jgi:Fem-1 family protein b
LDIVEHLIKNNADVHIPNKFNNTCLMIASYRGHCDVVTFLLENHANPNTHAQCGATALHFAAERGHLPIVKEICRFGAKMVPNNQHLTPLMVAAECSRADIVEFFITRTECSRKDRIEALELLGASYANDKDNYDVDKAYHYIWLAMQERYSEHGEENNVLMKNIQAPVPAYENMIECSTVAELEEMKVDHNAIHMQALILRERILGENNAEIPHPIIFRGAVFADAALFDRCTSLWMHALKLRQRNDRTITKDILRFAQVFSQMIHLGVGVDFNLAMEVYRCTLNELERDLKRMENALPEEVDSLRENHECNIHTALYLLMILTKVNCNKKQEHLICTVIYQFTKLKLVLKKNGYTPLHMVVDDTTLVDDFHVNDVVKFPSAILTRLLVRCGANCNAVDTEGNTPLHVMVRYNKPISDFMTLHSVIMVLIEGGVHIDRCNDAGLNAMEESVTGVADIILRTQRDISLKCIAAKAVKKQGIIYKNEIPQSLEEFVDMH